MAFSTFHLQIVFCTSLLSAIAERRSTEGKRTLWLLIGYGDDP